MVKPVPNDDDSVSNNRRNPNPIDNLAADLSKWLLSLQSSEMKRFVIFLMFLRL